MFEKSDVKDIYGLTPLQDEMLSSFLMDPSGASHLAQTMVSLDGEIDVRVFRKAFELLVKQHDVLRTVFLYRKVKKPTQVVLKSRETDVEYFDVSSMNEEQVEHYIEGVLMEDRKQGFAVDRDPLLRLRLIKNAPRSWKLIITNHHLILDNWSIKRLVVEFIGLYEALIRNEEVGATPNVSFGRYVKWLEERNLEDSVRFWQRRLSGYEEQADFPRRNLRGGGQEHWTAEYKFQIDERLTSELNEISTTQHVSVSSLFQCLLGIVLGRFNNIEDVVFGNVVSGRPMTVDWAKEIIGLFGNIVPVRICSGPEETFDSLVRTLHQENVGATSHEYVPLAEIQTRTPFEQDLYRVIFECDDHPVDQLLGDVLDEENSGVSLVDIQRFQPLGSEFNCIVKPGRSIGICLNYNPNVYDERMVGRIARSFQTAAAFVSQDPHTRIRSIPLVSSEEARELVSAWNDTRKEYDLQRPVHDMVQDRVSDYPSCLALAGPSLNVSRGENPLFCQLTYNFLWRKAGELAGYLTRETGLHPQEPVAILLEPAVERVMALLGVLRAGGAFVPIDPSLPPNRIRFIVNDASIRVVISQKKFIGLLNHLQWECASVESFLCLDSEDVGREVESSGNRMMDREFWEYVGKTADDPITAGGWRNSYTGEPFGIHEIDEYRDNVGKKLEPLLKPDTRVLEIGCGSGITMFRLAPQVALYYGVDMSQAMIERNRRELERGGITNIRLECLAAHEIEEWQECEFDLIVFNSVVHCFHGHNYLRRVLGMCIDKLKDRGHIFIGDVMDLDGKEEFLADLRNFIRQHPENKGNAKSDFSNELFLSKDFFEDLPFQFPVIQEVRHSNKIYSIENELTRFRYDTILTIDSECKRTPGGRARKHRHDMRALLENSELSAISPARPVDLAYIIYTSGSTGRPKGVMVEHRSLANLCWWHKEHFAVTHREHATQYAGFGFDAAVWEVFPYLVAGAALFVIPNHLKLEIRKLNQFFHRHDITAAFLPTQFCEQFLELDNVSLRIMLTGGDKLNRFSPQNYMLFNNYGPTENTVVTTSFPVDRQWENIPVGTPMGNVSVFVMARHTVKAQPDDVPGEICIGGEGLARGYLNRPELTAESFIEASRPENESQSIRLYRSGDLGRRFSGGPIEFLGRLDHQVKIRGLRIELGEIESRILCFDGVAAACVAVRQHGTGGDKMIVAYLVPDGDADIQTEQLCEFLLEDLPSYMVPSGFVFMQRLPLTANGKVDRKALPAPSLTPGNAPAVREEGNAELALRLAALFAEVLGGRKEDEVDLNDNFFKIGGHSLTAVTLVSRIHEEMGVQIPISGMFASPSPQQLADFIRRQSGVSISPVQPLERKEYYPLSSAQQRMYILHQMMNDLTVYNMPAIFRLEREAMDERTIESVFKALIQRHESLRTSFQLVGKTPMQRVWPEVDFSVQMMEVEPGHSARDMIDSFVRPFDLSHAPLLRVGVVSDPAGKNYLVLDMHHIISDGVSIQVLGREFFQLAAGEQLEPLRVQYKDISAWQASRDYQLQLQSQFQYWMRKLEGPLPALELPLDFPRPEIQDFNGSSVAFYIGKEERCKLRSLEERFDMTLFVGLKACFHLLLWILSGQRDIVTGFPVAGRRYADMRDVVGMFVNTLALRSRLSPQSTLEEFLNQIKREIIAAFDNQDVPFEKLVEQLDIRRCASRNPVFDVMLALQNLGGDGAATGTLDIDQEEDLRRRVSRFDMTWSAAEINGGIRFQIEYCTSLFKEETVLRLAEYYQEVVRFVCRHPGQPLQRLRDMAESEGWSIAEESVALGIVTEMPQPLGPISVEVEIKLAEIWAAVLSKELQEFSSRDDFFSLGGHSLKAVELTNAIYREFGVEVGVQEIFQAPTILEQAALLGRKKTGEFKEIPVLQPMNVYPASYSQKRIWLLQHLNPGSTVFNIPVLMKLPPGEVNPPLARQVFQALASRHEAFRTYFLEQREEIVQVISDAVDIPLQEFDLAGSGEDERQQALTRLLAKESQTPFNLQKAPLFRAAFLDFGDAGGYIFFNMHHIVSDGWSMQILQRELIQIYRKLREGDNEPLTPLRIQYKEFAAWQNRMLEDSSALNEALDFWKRYLHGDLPVLDLPYDFPENRRATAASAGFRIVLESETCSALQEIARRHEASLFMVLLAGFQIALSLTRGGQDIMLGIPGAARQHDGLKQIIGLFVNTLIVRGQVDGGLAFEDFLKTLRDNVFLVLEHQSIPLELVFEKLGISYPKLTVFFNMVNIGATELFSLGDSIEPSHREAVQDAKFPLTLYLTNWKEGLEISCHYFKELFLPATVQSILDLYFHVLRGIAKNPTQVLKDYRRQPKKRLARKRSLKG